ncbi:6-bladed beta-propeller [Gemmatimonadota bacterium]
MYLRNTVVCCSVTFLIACSSGADNTPHSFELSNEGGVVVARNSGVPKFEGELFDYEQVLEIRGDPDKPESLLYRPSGFVRLSDGTFLVADSGNHRIAVFNSDGDYVRSFGREGDGPGEFRWIARLRTYGNQVLVFDAMLRRTYSFQPDGLLLDSVSNPLPFFSRIPTLWPTPEGHMVVITAIDERANIGTGIDHNATIVLSASLDTLAVVHAPKVTTSHRYPAGPGLLSAPIYFAGASLCRYYPEKGLVVTGGEEPIVEWYSLNGTLTHRIAIDLPKEPVGGEDRSRIKDFLEQQVTDARPNAAEGSGRLRPEMARGLRDHAQYVDFKAYWDMIRVDSEGYIWLQLSYEDGSMYPQAPRERQRLLSPQGEYLGISEWPAVDGVTWIGQGVLLAFVVEEDTGLQVPVVFAIKSLYAGMIYPGRE